MQRVRELRGVPMRRGKLMLKKESSWVWLGYYTPKIDYTITGSQFQNQQIKLLKLYTIYNNNIVN